MTRAWSNTRCTRCGHEETRDSAWRCCSACGGPLERPQMADDNAARLELARRIVARAWLWAVHDSELRDLLRKWEAS